MRSVSGERIDVKASAQRHIALATCRELPQLDEDTRQMIAPLCSRGINVTAAVWDDPGVDWSLFDLVVVRSCWDFVPRRDEFLGWSARVVQLSNPAAVLAWNTDKRYLQDLAARGVPTVPTSWLEPAQEWKPPASGDWVIKPAVSMASLDTGRYCLEHRDQRCLAVEHVRRLQADGRAVMAQPYMQSVDNRGEISLGIWVAYSAMRCAKPLCWRGLISGSIVGSSLEVD